MYKDFSTRLLGSLMASVFYQPVSPKTSEEQATKVEIKSIAVLNQTLSSYGLAGCVFNNRELPVKVTFIAERSRHLGECGHRTGRSLKFIGPSFTA
jgi:hypothetical protein